jgi:D-alanyl-D-alanine carboxypeptidase
VAGLLLLAGCGSGSHTSTSASSSAGPSAAGSPSGLPQLGAKVAPVVQQAMKQLVVPGAVVLVATPNGRYEQAFGVADLTSKRPMTVDDHFRVGSNTKTMTGTVVLQLAQEGKLSLNDPVSKYFPDVPNGQNITITQLLEMRSGLHSYSELESFNATLDNDPTKAWQPQELLNLGLSQPPYFPPGQGYHYSNTNTILLGMLIEKLTGQKLEDAFQSRIFTPLGLKQTSFPPKSSNAIPDPHPQGYFFGTNVSTLTDPAIPADQQAAAAAGTLKPNDVTNENPSWGWSAGAAISTAGDLATYVHALITGGLLNAEYQKIRMDSLIPADPSNPAAGAYGMALAKLGPFLGHDGSLPGFQSFMGYDPDTKTTMIVLTNLQNAPDGKATANEIARAIIPLLG